MGGFVQKLTSVVTKLSFLKGFREIISFLTIFPMGENRLSDAPDNMFAFPIVGVIIGALTGLAAIAFFHLLPNPIAGTLTVGFLFLITGVHHIDGLLDFGDGLMTMGSASEKIRAMRDRQVGVGGNILGLIVILTTVFTISNLGEFILGGLIICETSAKFSMVIAARLGTSARRGTNTRFIETMKGGFGNLQLFLALIISLFPVAFILKLKGFIPLLGSMIVVFIIVPISQNNFKGLTGDVFGAINELSRLVSLLFLLPLI